MKWKALVSFGILFCGFGFSQPIVKTGDCPDVGRYNAPSGEDWSQFDDAREGAVPPDYPIGSLQNPMTPEQSVNCAMVPDGLQAQIIASENTPGDNNIPMAYLMYFDFDAQGRVWALDVRDYPGPTGSNRATGGDSRILILEDTDNDGAMDNFTTFYEGLVIPTSIVTVDGGVVVTVAPYIYFIPNNNDQGGTPQVLFSGMGTTGTFDTHGQINSLTYGLDNWIYGQIGYNGDCRVNGVDCDRGSTWRFRHTDIGHRETAFQAWTDGPWNAHGVGQMENGEIFQSAATVSIYSNHSIRRGVRSVALVPNRAPFYPPTNDFYVWEGSTSGTSVNTAVSGHDFYTARLLPSEFNNRLYVCEGATKHCHQDDLDVNGGGGQTGSTWEVDRITNPSASRIIGSTDAWFAPLKVRTGPDGGLWVIDWYNYLFLHNPAQPTISGTFAWQNHLREKERTRIYRIIPEDGETEPYPPMTTEEDLIAALKHTNFMWRIEAQKQLIYRGMTETLGTALEAILTGSRSLDDMGNDPRVTHAIWVLEGLGELEDNATRWGPIMQNLLKHPAWVVRRNALMAMPRTSATADAIEAECMTNDDHGHVRLQAMVALAESPGTNGPAMWSTFDGVDGHITSARNAANVSTSGSRPCSPDYDPVVAVKPVIEHAGYKLNFSALPGGFRMGTHPGLVSGELLVHDLMGREVFRSRYNSESGEWSRANAENLNKTIYTYIYRDVKGGVIKGQVAPHLAY